MMSSDGRLTRSPSSSLPDLIEMQSSFTSISTLRTRTLRDESMSIPSELGMLWSARMSSPSTVTSCEYKMCRHQTACCFNRKPEIRTRLQFWKQIMRGRPSRGPCGAAGGVCWPRAAGAPRPLRCNHRSPDPSTVPSPPTSTPVMSVKFSSAEVHSRSMPSQRVFTWR